MRFLMLLTDVSRIPEYSPEELSKRISRIVAPYHLSWQGCCRYVVQAGYDEDCAVYGAIRALEETAWLNGAVHVQIGYETVQLRLGDIQIRKMNAPKKRKINHYRTYFEDKMLPEDRLPDTNVIVVNENHELVDGYITYLLMKERGLQRAECLLVRSDTQMLKYVCGIHIPNVNDSRTQHRKIYSWSYPLTHAVVPGDILLADTSCGDRLIQVTHVCLGTPLYVNRMKKIKQFACSESQLRELVWPLS